MSDMQRCLYVYCKKISLCSIFLDFKPFTINKLHLSTYFCTPSGIPRKQACLGSVPIFCIFFSYPRKSNGRKTVFVFRPCFGFYFEFYNYLLLIIFVSSTGSTILPSLYTRILPEAISSIRITSSLL